MVPTKSRPVKKPMTQAHKAKLAEGRNQSRVVSAYLEALTMNKPRRGRKVDASPQRLAALDKEIDEAFGVRKLELVQLKLELDRLAKAGESGSDVEALRKDFVKVAKSFGQRKGISYAAWRQVGVPAEVLRDAGIGR